jgi:hypothetical protein
MTMTSTTWHQPDEMDRTWTEDEIANLTDGALCGLAEKAEKGAPFTEHDYELLFNEMDARGMFDE